MTRMIGKIEQAFETVCFTLKTSECDIFSLVRFNLLLAALSACCPVLCGVSVRLHCVWRLLLLVPLVVLVDEQQLQPGLLARGLSQRPTPP